MKILKALALFMILVLFGASSTKPPQFISPDSKVNAEMLGKSADQIKFLRFEFEDGKLTLDPKLPSDWTWFAGKGFDADGSEVQFFFWSGILFSNRTDLKYTNFRNRKYPKVFDDVQSNAFTICFQSHDEAVLFSAVDEEQDVEIIIPEKYLGKELKFNFHLKKNEAKFIRIGSTNPPFRP